MADRKFVNRDNDNNSAKQRIDKTKIGKGTTQDLLKKRKEAFNDFADELETQLKDWDGGGLVMVMNEYDENNNTTGARVVVLGCDDIGGLMSLAKATHVASEDIVETTVKRVTKEGGSDGVLALLDAALKMKMGD